MADRDSKPARRTRDPQGARKALLDAGLSLFEKNGYAGTSVQSIVDAAGLTKGAFYHHFESKDDLLRSVHDEFIDYQLAAAKEIVANPDLDHAERLRRLIRDALLEPMAKYQSEITVFLQERRFLSSDYFAEIQAKRDAFERCFVEVIDDGMRAGVFRSVGLPRVLSFGIIGMGAWTNVWLDFRGTMSPTQIGDMYADVILGGLVEG